MTDQYPVSADTLAPIWDRYNKARDVLEQAQCQLRDAEREEMAAEEAWMKAVEDAGRYVKEWPKRRNNFNACLLDDGRVFEP